MGEYAIARVLAATTSADSLQHKLEGAPDSFAATFSRLFGDPRAPVAAIAQQSTPFLAWPLDRPAAVTSFFDHEAPYLQQNGSIVTGSRSPRSGLVLRRT